MKFMHILIFRIINALLINTLFEPDEIFQNIDPLYYLILNNCDLTWDWICGIRSFLFPMIFYLPALLLKNILCIIFGENNWKEYFLCINFYAIKLIFALISSIADFSTLRLAEYFNIKVGNILLQHGLLLYACRTHINSMEMHMVPICAFLLMQYKITHKNLFLFSGIFLTAYMAYLRISFIFIIFPYFFQFYKNLKVVFYVILIGIFSLAIFVCVDSFFYGEFIIPPVNFILYNIIYKISEEFGVQSPFSYLLWFFILTGLGGLKFLLYRKNLRHFYFLQLPVIIYVLVYSLASHKEMRFILPVIPFVFILSSRENRGNFNYLILFFAIYLNYAHQNYTVISEVKKLMHKNDTLSLITVPYNHPHNLFFPEKINCLYGNLEIKKIIPTAKLYSRFNCKKLINTYDLFFDEFFKNLRNIDSTYVVIDDKIFYYSYDILHKNYAIKNYFVFSRAFPKIYQSKIQFILQHKK